MAEWKSLEGHFTERVHPTRRPVAVTFLDREPTNVPKFMGTEPSGCSFWRLAAEGRTFYTVPSHHYNCAVGSYTHNIPLPPERAHETEQTLKMMFDVGYIRPEEVRQIARLAETPAAVVYAPLGDTPLSPSVVLFTVKPAGAMLLNEAVMRSGCGASSPLLGRPTCMALPVALTQGATMSLGCIGNRIYTGAGEDELYVAIPGVHIERVAAALAVIAQANAALGKHAQTRRADLSTA